MTIRFQICDAERLALVGRLIFSFDATRTTAGPAAWRHRAALVGVNVALSTVLLIASGLLIRSFVSLLKVNPGFDPRGVLTMEVELNGRQYAGIPNIASFYDV